jgi:hypothetical protein
MKSEMIFPNLGQWPRVDFSPFNRLANPNARPKDANRALDTPRMMSPLDHSKAQGCGPKIDRCMPADRYIECQEQTSHI